MANFRRGVEAAQEAASNKKGQELEFFSIKEANDPRRIVRFVTDLNECITTTMHPSQLTRPEPPNYKGSWPKRMGAVCRMDSRHGDRTFPEHADCFLCITPNADGTSRSKNERTWGMGILRQQQPDGSMVDMGREIDVVENGVTVTKVIPAFVIFQMAWSNFWSSLEDQFRMRGTILDRDFQITRKGFTKDDTDYGIAPYDPLYIPDGKGGTKVLDFRDPDVRALYQFPAWEDKIAEQASDFYYQRFFDTRFVQPTTDPSKPQPPATQVQTPATEQVNPATVSALADRLSGIPGVAAVPPAAAPVAPTPYGAQVGVPAAAPAGVPTAAPQQG